MQVNESSIETYLLGQLSKGSHHDQSTQLFNLQQFALSLKKILNGNQNVIQNEQLQKLFSQLASLKFNQDHLLEDVKSILQKTSQIKWTGQLYLILVYLLISKDNRNDIKEKQRELYLDTLNVISNRLQPKSQLKVILEYWKQIKFTTGTDKNESLKMDGLSKYLSQITLSQNLLIQTITCHLLRMCLFKYMMAYAGLETNSKSIEKLQIVNITEHPLIPQEILDALLQNIYLLSMQSSLIFDNLIQWITVCFSNNVLQQYICSGNQLLIELNQILMKVFEVLPTASKIRPLIKSLRTFPHDSILVQKIIKQILLINNHKIVDEHLVELIYFDIYSLYPLIYSRLLPYALKSIDKIKQNVLLINYIVKIKFYCKDDWNITIKNQIFTKFFQHFCYYLVSDNLILLYENIDSTNNELFHTLVNSNNKIKAFPNRDALIHYLSQDQLLKDMNEKVFRSVARILSYFIRKSKTNAKIQLKERYATKLNHFYENLSKPQLETTLRMIQLQSSLQRQYISRKIQSLFQKICKQAIVDNTNSYEKHFSILIDIFRNQPCKTSTLSFLHLIFCFLVSASSKQEQALKYFSQLKQTLLLYPYYKLRCYSQESFDQLLFIHSIQGLTQNIIQNVEQLILLWINYANIKAVHHVYEIAKYESSSQFLQERIRLLKGIDENMKCRVFCSVDRRLTSFLKLFYKIISFQNLQKASDENRCIVYSYDKNTLDLTYTSQKQNDSNFQILITLETNPKYFEAVHLFIRQPNIEYEILIQQNKIRMSKNSKQDSKLINQIKFQSSSTLLIKIKVDLEMQTAIIAVNKQQFQLLVLTNNLSEGVNNKTTETIHIVLQSQDSFIQSVDLMYNTKKKIAFNMNTSNQTIKKFTLNIREMHLTQIFNAYEYFSLNYLFVFILQIANNQLSYSLQSIQSIFPLLYKILFYHLEFPPHNQYYGLFSFLQYVTKAIIQITSTISFDQIRDKTIKLMQKPNRMVFQYFKQIILNFEIWSLCPYFVQNLILQIVIKVLKSSPTASNMITEDVSCFNQIAEYIIKYYQPSSQSKTLSTEQKEQLNLKVQEILFLIITNSNEQLFMKYLSYVVLSNLQQRELTRGRRRSSIQTKVPGNLIQNIVIYTFCDQQSGRQKKKNLFVLLFQIKQFKYLVQNIEIQIKQKMFDNILKLCNEKQLEKDVFQSIRVLLSSMPLAMIQNYLDTILMFLENTNKLKSQQKLIISFLSPFLYRYPAFSLQTKDKILIFLIIFYQANSNLEEKSNFFSVRLLAIPEFVELLTNLTDETETNVNIRNKSKKLMEICLKVIPCMTKFTYFNFLYLFRRKAGSRIKVLLVPIQNFEASQSSVTDCSLILQYAYQCLLVFQSLRIEKEQSFFTSIYTLIQNIMYQKQDQLYYSDPPLQNTGVSNIKIMNFATKSFQIRGGILMKLTLLLFKYLELTEDIKIMKRIRDLIIFNVEKSQDLKNFKKRNSINLLGIQFKSRNNINIINQFELIVKRTTKVLNQKKKQTDIEVGEDIFDAKKQKFDLSQTILQYVILKLALFRGETRNQTIHQEVDQLINDISIKFPHLNNEYDPENISLLETSDYSQFIKTFTQDMIDLPRSSGNMDKISPLRRSTSHKYDMISPIKRKSEDSKPLFQISQIYQISDLKTRFIKQNAPLKAYRLLKMQFIYLYLLRNNIAFPDDENYNEQENQNIMKDFKKYIQKQNEMKTQNRNNMNVHWNQFLKKVEGEDGLLYDKTHKKKPILKLRSLYLPNMVRAITKQTSEYQYQLMKQQILSLDKKNSFLSYSFLKPRSFYTTQKRNSLIELIPSTVVEEIDQSGSLKFDCEWVTRRGVYFCSFSLDLDEESLSFQTNINGRPEKGDYKFGSTKDSIIKGKNKTKQLSFQEIKQIQIRKFNQISGNSFQIFTYNCRSYFLVFYQVKNVKKIFGKLNKKLKAEQLVSNCQLAFKERKYTEKWQNGRISNFDYLMMLNIFSGRTFNDPNQYPIFPWVLQDYTSNQINLNKPESYRNLSLPIGALNSSKLERYLQNSKVQEEDEEYLYGSFMSTSMFVFFYLIRIQPFSSLARELQGGSFDSPDRLFSSIADVWKSVTCESNTSDVKQLIPQFYSMNIFLQNVNRLNLGKTQNNVFVDDVLLPPWAHNNCNTFVSVMKEALESDIVSSKLHLWIDLVFGAHQYSKQRFNQFHPRYYQQNINFNQVQEHEIQALIAQITYFGQFPKKLFTKDHPPRIQNIKKTLKFKMILTQDLDVGKVEKIKKVNDLFIISIYQNKHSKNYAVKIPFEKTFKRVEINKSAISKHGELVLMEHKNQILYYKSSDISVFLKRYRISTSFRKAIVNERFIILCGRDLTVLNMEGQNVLSLAEVEAKTAVLLDNILTFIDKKFNVRRLHLLSPSLVDVIYSPNFQVFHSQLLGYKMGNSEGYLLCFNRDVLVYISN